MGLDNGYCPLCCQFMAAYVSAYRSKKFIDGRRYEAICPVCNDVPKTIIRDKDGSITATHIWSPDSLKSLDEMIEEGWSKEEAKLAIQSVKKAIKNGKPLQTITQTDITEPIATTEDQHDTTEDQHDFMILSSGQVLLVDQ